jgi:uncharacterized membrane protein
MIFGYTYDEAKKAVVSAVFLVAYIVGLILLGAPDLGFAELCVAVVGPAFAVAAVFMETNATSEDLSKAIGQLQGAVLAVVGYFTVIDPETIEVIGVIVGGLISVYTVFRTRNTPALS